MTPAEHLEVIYRNSIESMATCLPQFDQIAQVVVGLNSRYQTEDTIQ